MTGLVLGLRGAAAIVVLTMIVGGMPRVVGLGLAVVVGLWTALVAGPLVALAGATVDGIVMIAVREVAIGATMGLVAAMPLVMAATAGRMVDVAGHGRGSYGALFSIVAAAVFVGIDGHVAVIEAIGESFRVVPVMGQVRVMEAVGALIGAAVRLAIPWLVTAAVVEIGIGVGVRVGGRAALQAPVGAAVPAAMVMMTATLVGTLAVGVAALIR